MMQHILFVCLGNICRSPTAEAVVRSKAAARGMALTMDSAGTGRWHVGDPPHSEMQAAALARGYDLSSLRARQVVAADLRRFDMILGMDGQNLADLRRLFGTEAADKLRQFTDFAPEGTADHVPDPYYTGDFSGTLDLVEQCAEGVLDHLQGAGAAGR